MLCCFRSEAIDLTVRAALKTINNHQDGGGALPGLCFVLLVTQSSPLFTQLEVLINTRVIRMATKDPRLLHK
jgi:hypothetical protein